ncbi:hypothetical protein D9M68_545920 [compost metagenome]
MGMAPPLLVVTSTKGHMGWDEPVRDSVVCLPYGGRSLGANHDRTRVTGGNEERDACRKPETRQAPNKKGPPE